MVKFGNLAVLFSKRVISFFAFLFQRLQLRLF